MNHLSAERPAPGSLLQVSSLTLGALLTISLEMARARFIWEMVAAWSLARGRFTTRAGVRAITDGAGMCN